MKANSSMLDFMVKDHGRMYGMLSNLRMSLGRSFVNADEKIGYLDAFMKREEAHVYIEEVLIFEYNNDISKVVSLDVIRKQHLEIVKSVKSIKEDLLEGRDCNLGLIRLQEFMKEHLKLEEKKFYPLLDEMLSEKQREDLIRRVSAFEDRPKQGVLKRFIIKFLHIL